MDVNRHNFDEILPELATALNDCVFVALDLEFSGLGAERPSNLDTPALRYEAAQGQSTDFPPLQCGLALFRQCDDVRDTVQWEVRPYNVALYPRAIYAKPKSKYPVRDRLLKLQASSADFLISHGFDFQKSFADGVSWLRKGDEEAVRNELCASHDRAGGYLSPATEEEQTQLDEFLGELGKWCKSTLSKTGSKKKFINKWNNLSDLRFTRAAELHYPRVRLSFFPGHRNSDLPASFTAEVMQNSEDAKKAHENDRLQRRFVGVNRLLSEAVGFRKIVDLLIEKRKPFVLHHGLLDITKLVANFVHKLPKTLCAFKRDVRNLFPVIWDTRVLLAQTARKYKWLSDLLVSEKGRRIPGIIEVVQKNMNPNSVPYLDVIIGDDIRPEYPAGTLTSREHEAGYDSVQAGRLFLHIAGFLLERSVTAQDIVNLGRHQLFEGLQNRIYLGSCGGYTDLHFGLFKSDEDAAEKKIDEDDRNLWLTREDVVVVKGVHWEAGEGLEKAEMPWAVYESVIGNAMRNSVFSINKSTLLPCANGSCVVVLKKADVEKEEPPSKKVKLNNGRMELASKKEESGRSWRIYDVIPFEIMDEVKITMDEVNQFKSNAKDLGLNVVPYRKALNNATTRRMRFVV